MKGDDKTGIFDRYNVIKGFYWNCSQFATGINQLKPEHRSILLGLAIQGLSGKTDFHKTLASYYTNDLQCLMKKRWNRINNFINTYKTVDEVAKVIYVVATVLIDTSLHAKDIFSLSGGVSFVMSILEAEDD